MDPPSEQLRLVPSHEQNRCHCRCFHSVFWLGKSCSVCTRVGAKTASHSCIADSSFTTTFRLFCLLFLTLFDYSLSTLLRLLVPCLTLSPRRIFRHSHLRVLSDFPSLHSRTHATSSFGSPFLMLSSGCKCAALFAVDKILRFLRCSSM